MRKTFKEVDYTLPTKEQLQGFWKDMKSVNSKRSTRSLFIETVSDDVLDRENVKPIFTLKDNNHTKDDVLYFSLKNIYFSYEHIPGYEYQFAKDVFNDWNHWLMVADAGNGIREAVASWRDELSIKLQAKAFSSLYKTALTEGAKGTPAARFLADRGWEVKRGRPSKDEVARERKIAAGVDKEVQEDMTRLGLTLVKSS